MSFFSRFIVVVHRRRSNRSVKPLLPGLFCSSRISRQGEERERPHREPRVASSTRKRKISKNTSSSPPRAASSGVGTPIEKKGRCDALSPGFFFFSSRKLFSSLSAAACKGVTRAQRRGSRSGGHRESPRSSSGRRRKEKSKKKNWRICVLSSFLSTSTTSTTASHLFQPTQNAIPILHLHPRGMISRRRRGGSRILTTEKRAPTALPLPFLSLSPPSLKKKGKKTRVLCFALSLSLTHEVSSFL